MSKIRQRLSALAASLSLILILPGLALASTAPAPVDPSDDLSVYVRINGEDTLLHTYSLAEMEDLTGGSAIYSALDSMPCPVVTEAEGVYLDDLIEDAGQYTSYDLNDYQYLRTRSTDGGAGKFTKSQLFGNRYYFPGLHEENGAWDWQESAVDTSALGSGNKVQPMLAIRSNQERRPTPASSSDNRSYEPECYTLLFGSTMDELENCEMRVSQYRRGCCAFIIDLGTVAADTPLTRLTLDKSNLSLTLGANAQLSVTPVPANATDSAVSWNSSNPAVAQVSTTGVVTAQGLGNATITVSAHSNSTISATCLVTVSASQVPVSGVTISRTSLTLAIGGERQLTALLRPANSTNTSLTWRSDDTDIATVNANGLIKAIQAGETEIIVTAVDGGFTASCALTVTTELIALTDLALDRSTATIAKGDSLQLEPLFTPENTTEMEVTWSSSEQGVASVSANGLVYGRNLGVSLITLRSTDGKYSATCQVTVANTAAAFGDTASHWASTYIEEMVAAGYINGYSDGSFQPNRPITRAEFLSILMRILADKQETPLDGTALFSDTTSHWAKDYIAAAVAHNIAAGTDNGLFRPDAAITREQLTLMLSNAVQGDGSDLPLTFTDSAAVAVWARDGVAFALSQGWVSGYGDGSFAPAKTATRGEVCAILSRFCQYYQ